MPELDLGNVKGPQGKSAYQSALDAGYSGSEEAFNTAMAKAPDAVLYAAQSLTDKQKAQARGNINAAPGGFGLGEAARTLTASDNVDNVKKNGWYTWHWDPTRQPAGLPDEAKYHTGLMRVDSANPNTYDNVQTIYIILSPPNSNPGDQCVVQRMGLKAPNVWNPWEWVNPPMELGTEYRTTERYLGKPLYKKLIEFPSLTGRDYQQVHGRDGFVISAIGEVRSPQDTNFWMPMVVNPVAGQADAPFPTIAFSNFYSADVGVVCASTSPYIGQSARVLVTYYKTTD